MGENGNPTGHQHVPVEKPYVLLDIRSAEEYERYHIRSSVNFNSIRIRRDDLGDEIYKHKNKKGHMVIVCSDTESDTIKVANELVQKFIDNVYTLSTSVLKYLGRFNDDACG